MTLDLLSEIVALLVFGRERQRAEEKPVNVKVEAIGGGAPRAPWVDGRPIEAKSQTDRRSP